MSTLREFTCAASTGSGESSFVTETTFLVDGGLSSAYVTPE